MAPYDHSVYNIQYNTMFDKSTHLYHPFHLYLWGYMSKEIFTLIKRSDRPETSTEVEEAVASSFFDACNSLQVKHVSQIKLNARMFYEYSLGRVVPSDIQCYTSQPDVGDNGLRFWFDIFMLILALKSYYITLHISPSVYVDPKMCG